MVDVEFLDFAKIFDKVPHQWLLIKLASLKWVKNWLLSRMQRVRINGTVSDWKLVFNAVPQGSVLGS